MDFNGLQIEEISLTSPEQSKVRCTDSSVCSANQYCSNGYCKDEDPSQKPSPSVGECEETLPDPEEDSDCDDIPETGGCDEAGCGEPVGEEPTPCEEKEEEEEEEEEEDEDDDSFKKCSPFADEYFKSYGKYPAGYGPAYVCGECEDCEYTNDYFCEPHDSFTFDVDCNCLEKDYCLNKYGPCYKCGGDGECYLECDGCQVECMEYFECPCDKNKKKFKATGYYSPCRPTTAYGPGGTCWSSIKDKVEAFCTETFGDDCDSCVDDCEGATQQGVYEYNCASTPPDKTCTPNGYMEVPDQPTVAFATICTKNPDCRCDGDPSSSNYKPCGLCEVCDGNGDCVPDPQCSALFGPGQRSSRQWRLLYSSCQTACCTAAEAPNFAGGYYDVAELVRYTHGIYAVDNNYGMKGQLFKGHGDTWYTYEQGPDAVQSGSLMWDAQAYIFRRIRPGDNMDRKTPIDRRVVSNFVDQQFLYRVQVRVTEPLYKPGKVWGTCDEGGSITLTHQTFAWPDAIECFGNFCASPRAYPVPCYYEDELEYVGLYHADNVYENGGDRVGVGEQFGMFVPQEFQGYRYPPGGHGRDWYGIGPDGEPSHWQDK